MFRVMFRRLVLSVTVLFSVSVLTYILARFIPGNPADTILGVEATPSSVAAFDKSIGWNRPIYQQYWTWLSGVLRGNLGRSLFTDEPVSRIVNAALPITVTLIIGAVVVAVMIGVPMGVAGARSRGRTGQVVDIVSLIGFGLPAFWLGLVLVIGLSDSLHLLPASGWVPFGTSVSGWARSLVLPVATLAVGGVAVVAKQTRDGMMEVLSRDFVRALRARGLSERSIIYKHALRNAFPNVVTMLCLYVVSLLLGTTIVESVFALQGLGSVAVQATTAHDLPILEGATLYFTVIIVVVFAVADIARLLLNPKLRTTR